MPYITLVDFEGLVSLTGLPHLFLRLLGSIDDKGAPLANQTPDAALAKNEKILDQIYQLGSAIDAHAAFSASNPAARREALLAFQGKVDAIQTVIAEEMSSKAMAATIVGQTLTLNIAKINPAMNQAMTGPHTVAQEEALLIWLDRLDALGTKLGNVWQMVKHKSAMKAIKNNASDDAANASIRKIEQDRDALKHGFAESLEIRKQTLNAEWSSRPALKKPDSKWAVARQKAAPGVAAEISSQKAALDAVTEALKALQGQGQGKKHQYYYDNWNSKIGSDGIGAGSGEAKEYKDVSGAEDYMKGLEAWAGLKQAAQFFYFQPGTKIAKTQLATLTYIEVLSLVAYTSNLYKDINNQRRFNTALSSMGFTNYVAVAAGALKKLPQINGFGFRHDEFAAYTTARQNGTTFTDAGFFSVAKTHEGTIGAAKHDVLTLLKYSNGNDISDLSYYGTSQAEVLFPPGTRWFVERRYERQTSSNESNDAFKARMDTDMNNPSQIHPMMTSQQLKAYGAGGHFANDKKKSDLKVVLCVRQTTG
jgi:hypothetical protein